jgi:hypothetical protein
MPSFLLLVFAPPFAAARGVVLWMMKEEREGLGLWIPFYSINYFVTSFGASFFYSFLASFEASFEAGFNRGPSPKRACLNL